MSDSSGQLVDFIACGGLPKTNMDVLKQYSLVLVKLNSQGKFLYTLTELAQSVPSATTAVPRTAVGRRRHTDTTSRHSSALVRTGQSHART